MEFENKHAKIEVVFQLYNEYNDFMMRTFIR